MNIYTFKSLGMLGQMYVGGEEVSDVNGANFYRVEDVSVSRTLDASIIAALTRQLDELVGACLDESGKPKAPDYRSLMAARGSLPPTAMHAFPAKK